MSRRRHLADPSYVEAVRWGQEDKACDPCAILQAHLDWRSRPSVPRLVHWLVQQAPEALLKPGPTLLLLRVASYLNAKSGSAWIGRRTLAALSDQDRKTTDTHAVTLTRPWQSEGDWFPPLFRLQLRGWGSKRLVHWIPLDKGWQAFIAVVALHAKARKEFAREARRRAASREVPK
jgi:hypothetical protein